MVLTAFYDNRKAQASINFVVFTLFCLYVIGVQPANTRFWRIEQSIVHFLMMIANLFVFILVIDDDTEKMSGKTRWNLGYIPVIIGFLVILWNTVVLIIKLIEHLNKCSEAKQGNVQIPHKVTLD